MKQKKYNPLEKEIKDLRVMATKGQALFYAFLPGIRKQAESLGIDVSSQLDEIKKMGYLNVAKNKLEDASEFINQERYSTARISLRLAEKYALESEDDDIFDKIQDKINSLDELEEGK